MSMRKIIQEEMDDVYRGLEKLAMETRIRQNEMVEAIQSSRPVSAPHWLSILRGLRNWITHIILWVLLCLSLSSCFVAARNVYTKTPWTEASADTVTAVVGRTYKPIILP